MLQLSWLRNVLFVHRTQEVIGQVCGEEIKRLSASGMNAIVNIMIPVLVARAAANSTNRPLEKNPKKDALRAHVNFITMMEVQSL